MPNYPLVPDNRMSYDRDGSAAVFVSAAGVAQTLSSSLAGKINDESTSEIGDSELQGDTATSWKIGVVFPELRDVAGYHINVYSTGIVGSFTVGAIETSADSTNLVDGAWTSRGTASTTNSSDVPQVTRNDINSVTWAGVKAVRVSFTQGSAQTAAIRSFHLYGSPSSTPTLPLMIWHPTLNQQADDIDWEDFAQGTTDDATFRVKNTHATLTANGVSVAMEALTETSPTAQSWHSMSIDGTVFGSTASVGALPPGGISGVITLRRATPSNAQLSLFTLRLVPSATSFT